MFREICGSSTRPAYNDSTRAFEIAPTHLGALIEGLLDRFGEVELTTEHYSQQTCVDKCWNASRRTVTTCVCGCGGLNHGTGTPFDRTILDGRVSVQGEYLTRTVVLTR